MAARSCPTPTRAAISGGFGGSGAVATNNIADQVTAEIDDATVRAIDNTVYVLVDDTANIQSLSLALAGGTAALAATVSVNEIGNTLDATIDAATVEGGNTVSLESSDNSTIKSSADELSAGVVGVGGGAAYNQIENTVDATIEDGSTVTADSGDVLVQAMEQAGITTLAAGGAGGLVGVGGSVSVSIIADNVTASIENSTVTAAGNIGVIGQANDTIDGYGGEIAGGAVGAAGSVTVITLESTVAAQVEGSTVAATGLTPALIVPDIDPTTGAQSTRNGSGVVVAAQDLENATDIAVTAAGGLAGLAGTVADVHTATITDAHITASTVNTAAHPGSGVLVHATQATIVNGTLGAGAVGFVAVGAAVQVITIDNQTRAYIADQRAGNENSRQDDLGLRQHHQRLDRDVRASIAIDGRDFGRGGRGQRFGRLHGYRQQQPGLCAGGNAAGEERRRRHHGRRRGQCRHQHLRRQLRRRAGRDRRGGRRQHDRRRDDRGAARAPPWTPTARSWSARVRPATSATRRSALPAASLPSQGRSWSITSTARPRRRRSPPAGGRR